VIIIIEDYINRFYKIWNLLTLGEKEEFNDNILVVHAAWATTVIEGSELVEDEVRDVLLYGAKVPKPLEIGAQEAINIKRAMTYVEGLKGQELTENLIKSLHIIVEYNVWDDIAGKYFLDRPLRAGRWRVPGDRKDVPKKMSNLVKWYNDNIDVEEPLSLATKFHAVFETIHPFRDGNGRTGRLLFSWMMIKFKYPPLVLTLDYIDDYYDGLTDAHDLNDCNKLYKYFETCYRVLTEKIEDYYNSR